MAGSIIAGLFLVPKVVISRWGIGTKGTSLDEI